MVKSEYSREIAMSVSSEEPDLLDSEDALTEPLLRSDGESSKTSSHGGRDAAPKSLFVERNKKLAKWCVMLTVVLERSAYYGLLGNLAFFLNIYLDFTAQESIIVTLVFSGITWISCFLGGIFGDAVFGRFKTITTGLIFYILGYISFSGLGHASEKFPKNAFSVGREKKYVSWVILSLLFVSFGEGCFKANMSAFGADQIEEQRSSEMRTFFNTFYWSINVGSFIGFSLIVWIQVWYGFCTGYIVPCSLLGLGLLSFVVPENRKNYKISKPNQNIFKVVKICCNSMRRKKVVSQYESFNPMEHRLDRAKIKYGGRFLDCDVEDVKTLFSLFPTFGFLILYCACYYQVNGIFLIQGLHMNIPTMGITVVPPAWFQLFNVIVVLLFVPVVEKFIYPLLDRFFLEKPYVFRISIGMFLASLSMVAAGVVEMERMRSGNNCTNVIYTNLNVKCKDLTVAYQFPQYFLMGISEIFVMITGLEFSYVKSPSSFRSFVTSLFFVTNGFGSLLTSAFIFIGNKINLNIISSYIRKHKSDPYQPLRGNLKYFFFFMGGLNLLNLFFFVCYHVRRSRRINKRQSTLNSFHDSLRKGRRSKSPS